MRKSFFLFLLSLLIMLTSFSQVINDDIEKRLLLKLDDSPFQSNTTNCTVQWKCVDTKAVTGCIKFHNDQWFEFKTTQSGQYYVSITNQQCRDVRGAQVMVIDGNPCEPATYHYIVCHSTGSQDNISLILDDLQANHTYMINVDGYLNDFCQFDIAVSPKAPQFTLFASSVEVPATSQIADSLVYLQWTLPDALQEDFTEFYILKRHASEKQSQEIVRFPAVANAYGARQNNYTYTDTMGIKGMHTYKIIGSSNQQRTYLLKELNLYYDGRKTTRSNAENLLTIDIPIRKVLNLSIMIFNAQTDVLLKKGYMMTSSKNKNQVKIDIAEFIAEGIWQYRVEMKEIDNPQGYSKTFLISP